MKEQLHEAQAAHQAGRHEEAERLYRMILSQDLNGDAAAGLGALLRGSGRSKEAETHYRWALNNCEWSPILISNACNWLREEGHVKDSLTWLSVGLQRWPKDLHLRWGLALSLHHAGKPEQALRQLEKLMNEHGRRPLLMRETLACLLEVERWDEALSTVEAIRHSQPEDVNLLQQQIKLLQRLQRSEEAWEILREQTILEGFELLKLKATLLIGDGNYQKALPLFEKIVTNEPDKGDNWLNLAACQKNMKLMVAPLKTLEMAVEQHPERSDLLQALGSIMIEHGRWQEGWPLLEKSTASENSSDVQHFNLQFSAAGNRLIEAKELRERAQRWENKRSLAKTPLWSDNIKDRSPNRRLRIGYLSQDLHNHPVGRFIEPVLKRHDRQQIEIIGVSCGRIHDDHSDKLKEHCDSWLDINGLNDGTAARKIADLELDILVELGGYTGGQRLRLLTAKPAPIQLSYLGYFASTHLQCIDGWIGDKVVFPKGLEEEAIGQTLYRLQRCYMSYEPDSWITPERTAKDERFRFGCFNHSRKLSDPTLDLFAKVLKSVPESLLVLKSQTFCELREQERILKRLTDRGIAKERIELLDRTIEANEHLSMYGKMDIALDPIPYGGATTTAEALWMGVPVICIASEGMVGRLSAAVLSGAGLEAAIATTEDGYITLAKRVASIGKRTNQQRQEIRDHLLKSDLMDSNGLARSLEKLYRYCWHSWLKSGR